MRIALCVLLLGLTACQRQTIRPPDLGPIAVTCSAECKADCLPGEWPQWTGNPEAPETWDALAEQVALPLREIAEQCNAARASCLRCIHNMEQAGILCGVGRECGQ
jgi:hypothetical protein